MPERFEIYVVYKRRYINTLNSFFFLVIIIIMIIISKIVMQICNAHNVKRMIITI